MSHFDRTKHNLVQMARNFAAEARPSREMCAQFKALMLAQYTSLGDEAKQEIANTLCLDSNIGEAVTALIAQAPANICGRFLRFSPLLNEEQLTHLVDMGDFQRNLALARRHDLPKSVARLLRNTCNADINRALDLRQKPTAVPAQSTPSIAVQLLDAARSRDLTAMCKILVQKLSISQESAFIILSERSSANVIVALKFCGLSEQEAWETYSYLAPGLAAADEQESQFMAVYREHDHDACSHIVRGWIMDELMARVSAPSIANDDLGAATDDLNTAIDMLRSA